MAKNSKETSKELEEGAKAPWFQFSFKKVVLYFLLALAVYALFIMYVLLNWSENRVCPPGHGMACALSTKCDVMRGIVPIVALVMLIVSIIAFIASRVISTKKKALTEFSVAMLFGFIFGILFAAVSGPFFNSFGLGC